MSGEALGLLGARTGSGVPCPAVPDQRFTGPGLPTVAMPRSRGGRGGDGLPGGVPGVAGPAVSGAGVVEVGDGAELAALGVVELAEPVVLDDDLRGGVGAGAVTAVDGVAAAGQEVVLDGLVRH